MTRSLSKNLNLNFNFWITGEWEAEGEDGVEVEVAAGVTEGFMGGILKAPTHRTAALQTQPSP